MVTTNVCRILEKAGIPFEQRSYAYDEEDLSGVHAAQEMGLNPEMVFKTLVAKGDKTPYCVFIIPVAEELDLKKCASVSGNKRVELIHVKELQPLTGYIRGGCSPVGMKNACPSSSMRRRCCSIPSRSARGRGESRCCFRPKRS